MTNIFLIYKIVVVLLRYNHYFFLGVRKMENVTTKTKKNPNQRLLMVKAAVHKDLQELAKSTNMTMASLITMAIPLLRNVLCQNKETRTKE